MRKTVMILALGLCMSGSCQSPLPTSVRYRLQEGFPVSELQRLNNRNLTLQSRMGPHLGVVQSVITTLQVWKSSELPLKVAFLGGSDVLRGQIVDLVQAWSRGSGISFDFGSPGAYREWTRQDRIYQAAVRIAFDEPGYWSWVGAQSIDPTLAPPNQPSMNFEGFAQSLPDDRQGIILHEFGHAIGFEHEHQSPVSGCDQQFRWKDDSGYVRTTDINDQVIPDPSGRRPGIYSVLEGPPNGWTAAQVDTNLKQLPATVDLRYTVFDSKSVMMYSFADWMFVSNPSPCFTPENLVLSAVDLQTAADLYPVTTPVTIPLSTIKAAQKLLQTGKLPDDVKAAVQSRLSIQ